MKKLFFLLLTFLLASSIFAQYSRNDYKLVKTTATREFNKEIILSYLNSERPQKVIAGLLSVSHSGDTSYVSEIVKLDFNEFGEYICFALGELGSSAKSSTFLFDKLKGKEALKNSHFIYDALGKIADDETIQNVLDLFTENKSQPKNGISIFIFNGYSRKAYFDKATVKQILMSEIKSGNEDRKLEALFALARLGGMKDAEKDLISIICSKDKYNSPQIKSFAIACFTRQKYFPNNAKLINQLYASNDWRVQVEAAKALINLDYTTKAQVANYFKLINDDNVNVSRQAAISIRNIKLNKTLLTYLNEVIEKALTDSKITISTKTTVAKKVAVKSKPKAKAKTKSKKKARAKTKTVLKTKVKTETIKSNLNDVSKGELFISLCSLNPSHIMTYIKKYDKQVEDKYAYEVLSNQAAPANEAYAYIQKKSARNEQTLLEMTPALLALQGKLNENKSFNNKLLEMLDSKHSSISSTVADGIDSSFASIHKNEIRKIVSEQIGAHLNDARYYETLISMANLSERIDKSFNIEILNALKSSKLFTVQKYITEKSGKATAARKDFDNFDSLWKNSFLYSKAEVKTQKGSFTIKFAPDYAPVSVGNFISLVRKDFYEGVTFHRVVPNFVAQTGDSTGTGFGGPGYDIISELSPLPFNTNYVGMASAGKDTEGSQWYVMHNVAYHLYGKYTNFGKVIEGMKVIPLINQGDKILTIKLIK